jgi:hypothetical protein
LLHGEPGDLGQRTVSGTAYRVKWREDGVWQSTTFSDKAVARRFKKDVEIFDKRWPEQGWVRVGLTSLRRRDRRPRRQSCRQPST